MAPEGIEKFGGLTAEVRAELRRATMGIRYLPGRIGRYNDVVRAIKTPNIAELARLTATMHPVERSRANRRLYADGIMNENWQAEIDQRAAAINVATNMTGTGPGKVFVYERENESKLLTLIEELYGKISLKPLYFRTRFSKAGTRELTLGRRPIRG